VSDLGLPTPHEPRKIFSIFLPFANSSTSLSREQADENVVHRRRWATQAELAARLGTVPDVLSRALRNLADESIISLERHQIQLLDRRRLMAKAGIVE
jgi:hypothetical protein